MVEIERALLRGRPARFVQLPTAAAPEGPQSLARWTALGLAQAERLGVAAVPLLVRDRADADDPALASQIRGAGLIYLSGGNPPYCAQTLRGTLVWEAVEQAWRDGAALAGCSAGAMALTSWVPDLRHPLRETDAGLGIVPSLRVIPHLLLVEWQTLEDHTEGFRGSEEYQEWRRLLHGFYDPFPTVEHFELVRDA